MADSEAVEDVVSQNIAKSIGFPTKRTPTSDIIRDAKHGNIDVLAPTDPDILDVRRMQTIQPRTDLETWCGSRYWVKVKDLRDVDPDYKNSYWYQSMRLTPFNSMQQMNRAKSHVYTKSWWVANVTKPDRVGLPRYFGIAHFGKPTHDIRKPGKEIECAFDHSKVTLRPEQVVAIDRVIPTLEEWGGAFVEAACGMGKTLLLSFIWAKCKRKGLFVSYNQALVDDLAVAIERFVPTAKVCKWNGAWDVGETPPPSDAPTKTKAQRKLIELWESDVIVTTMQTACMPAPLGFAQTVGFLALDEAHFLAAKSLSTIVAQWPCKYTFGVSATPNRKDRLEHALFWLIGPCAFRFQRTFEFTGVTDSVEVDIRKLTIPFEVVFQPDGKSDYTKTTINAAECPERNARIVQDVHELLKQGRKKILVLTKFRSHCEVLSGLLQDAVGAEAVTTLMGGTSVEDREAAKSDATKITVGTYMFVRLGYNDEDIDTVVFAIPIGDGADLQQSIGRAERVKPGKLKPLVVDYVDTIAKSLVRMSYRRTAQYKEYSYKLLRQKRTRDDDDDNSGGGGIGSGGVGSGDVGSSAVKRSLFEMFNCT